MNILCISVVSAGLILLARLLSKTLLKRYGAGVKQWVWVLIALRLVIPVSFAEVFEPAYESFNIGTNTAFMTLPLTYNNGVNELFHGTIEQLNEENVSHKFHFGKLSAGIEKAEKKTLSLFNKVNGFIDKIQYGFCLHLGLIWKVYVAGVVVFLLFHWLLYVVTCWRVNKNAYQLPVEKYRDLIRKIASEYAIKIIPDVFVTDCIASPMIMSVSDATIYLPKADYSEDEMEAILRHELMHLSHKDLLIKRLYLIANAMHWFNPAVYLMANAAGKDMELYCDQDVVKHFNIKERKKYNIILLGFLEDIGGFVSKHRFFTTSYQGDVEEMKTRFFNNLDMSKKKMGTWPVLSVLFMAIGFSAFIAFGAQKITADNLFVINSAYKSSYDDVFNNVDKYLTKDEQEVIFLHGSDDKKIAQQIYDNEPPKSVLTPFRLDDGAYIIKLISESGEETYLTEKYLISPKARNMDKVPEVEIYCDYQRIENYGFVINHWPYSYEGENETFDFFKEQVKEYNTMYDISDWRSNVFKRVDVLFPDDMTPDVVQVKDLCLDENGHSLYKGKPFEMLYHNVTIDKDVEFRIKGHPANDIFYGSMTSEEMLYRAIEMDCFWVTDEGLYGVTYMFVIGEDNSRNF